MEFRILGPLEVLDGDEIVGVAGQKQRELLAILLLSANQLVSSDRLIDELWGERSPRSGRSALHVRISQLRKALGRGGSQLVTRPPGYVLEVGPEQFDLARFERLVRESAHAEPAAAAAMLRDALALWRGPPLADVSYEVFAQAAIGRLEELRVAAIEKRIEADLALGRHAELISELGLLVAEHPMRERLRGQLMRALYCCGRQADALTVYRQTVALLRDELGLEPGPELRELERAILQHDPVLVPVWGSSLGQPQSAAYAPDARLPSPPTTFVGRARELAEVSGLLRRAETRLLTLTGPGGSGKTRLALRTAELLVDQYRDGAWFVDFSDVTDLELVAPTICQALAVDERPGHTPAERLSVWLKERELLLVLDNFEQLTAGAGVLAELLAACGSLSLLVTSREPLRLAAEQQYDVPVLSDHDATELFVARARAVVPGADIDSVLARELCARLDCLPLAIELAAARSRALSVSEMLDRLDRRLPLLTRGPRDAPRRQRTLRATIDWSYELLNDDEQRLFARLAVFSGGCALPAVEAVCGAELDELQALVDRSLVCSDGERYWLLETIREYGLERLGDSDEFEQLRAAHAEWFAQLMQTENLYTHPPPTARLHRLLVLEYANLRSTLEWAAVRGEYETVARVASPLTHYWWAREGRFEEAERWVGLALAHLDEYPQSLAAHVIIAARALAWQRGRSEAAVELSERALVIWRELGELDGMCDAMMFRDVLALERGDLAGARALREEVTSFAREHNLRQLPLALSNLADVVIAQGNLEEARELCDQALDCSEGPESIAGIGALMNLAEIANWQGRYGDGAALAREALMSARKHGDLVTAVEAATAIAWSLAELGELERSAQLLGATTAFVTHTGVSRQRFDLVCEERTLLALSGRLDEQQIQALRADGRTMPIEDALRDAAMEIPPDGPRATRVQVHRHGEIDRAARRDGGLGTGRRPRLA